MEELKDSLADTQPNSSGSFLLLLSKVEIAAGILIMVGAFAPELLRHFDIGPELHGVWGLSSMLFGWCGITLFLAGSGIRKYPAYPYLMHLPLAIWLVIVALAFA